jgi:sn-glycerol 3-phosphate transport system permease protein
MIPNYLIISKLGLNDNLLGVVLPQLSDATGIFLFRQSMKNIPKSLIEVASLDNISHYKIIRNIVIPLIKPAIISIGIMFFINSWNEYVWPVLILKSKENYTFPLALQLFVSSEGGTDFTIAMAVSVITMIIPLILYIVFQKYIINTFSSSGIKG